LAEGRVKLLFAARLRRAEETSSEPHSHERLWQIEYAFGGPIEYDVAGSRRTLTEGAVLAVPPGFVHHQTSPRESDSCLIKFERSSSRRLIVQPTLIQLTGPERQLTEHLLGSLVYEHDGRADGRGQMIQALIEQLLIWIKRWSRSASSDRSPSSLTDSRERVRLIGDLLRRKYGESFSVDDLAAKACLSRSRFLELFRAEFGASPVAFHTRARMEKAVELARYTGMSWKQVALQLGYDDPAYFSRAFKKGMGASPAKFLSRL